MRWRGWLALAAADLLAGEARAEECGGAVSRASLVPCALRASVGLVAERQAGEAAEARVVAASPWLPSNPSLALTASRRSTAGESGFNWSGTLSQELEIGGQRGARRRAAEGEREAQRQRAEGAEREVAVQAWSVYFEALAARDDRALSAELERVAAGVAAAARGMAAQGLLSAIDADVAAAASVRQRQARLAAERRLAVASAQLAHLVGADPMTEGLSVEGELEPLAGVEAAGRAAAAGNARDQAEVRALEAEGRALAARADGFRRARVPSLTLSMFVQNDGFGERVFGLGIGLPLPLPHPVGRSFSGEIAESEALGRRAATEADRLRRLRRLDVAVALRAFSSHQAEVEAFPAEQMERAERALRSIEQELRGGRLALRDAIVAQQSLVELRRARIEARKALCLASVQLARVAGMPLERGGP